MAFICISSIINGAEHFYVVFEYLGVFLF
jgi:hypothetical protein